MSGLNLYSSIFAEVYNLYWTEFIDIVAPQILAMYKKLDISDRNNCILDLCCGTGRLSKYILDHGEYKITGVDKSVHMIDLAKTKLKKELSQNNAELVIDDVVEYKPENRYGMVVSTFDSLNHMSGWGDLQKVFSNAYEGLVPGGIFIFDLNTKKGLKKWEFVDLEETEDLVLIFHGEYDRIKKKAFSKVYGFYRQGKNCWKKFEEVMSNNIFELDRVKNLLEGIGFTNVFFTEDLDLNNILNEPEGQDRVFVIASKL